LLCLGAARACPIDRCAIGDQYHSFMYYRWTDGPERGWLVACLYNRLTDGPTVYLPGRSTDSLLTMLYD